MRWNYPSGASLLDSDQGLLSPAMAARTVLAVFTGDGSQDVLGNDLFFASVEEITSEGSVLPMLPFLNMVLRR